MRFWWVVAVVIVGVSVSGLAQQKDPFRVKRSTPEKASKSTAPVARTASPKTASGASASSSSSSNSKDLQNLERQNAKAAGPTRTAGQKKTPALKLAKDKPNPPINFHGTSAKPAGSNKQNANPYAGRLKQKHAH
jgi:hypothetical protein